MTWTNIPDGNIDPDSPLRSVDLIAMRNNPIAIADGDPGAPRITDGALDTVTVSTTGTDWINNRIALSTVGAVGTYAFLVPVGIGADVTTLPGATLAGSSLHYADSNSDSVAGGYGANPSGTWRLMGYSTAKNQPGSFAYGGSLWLRIL